MRVKRGVSGVLTVKHNLQKELEDCKTVKRFSSDDIHWQFHRIWNQCYFKHYIDITVTSQWARWCLKSPASRLCTVRSGAVQRKHQSSLAFVRGIHRWAANSPHKGPVTRKMFPLDNVVMSCSSSECWIFWKNKIYICILYYISTLIWQRHVKLFLMKIKRPPYIVNLMVANDLVMQAVRSQQPWCVYQDSKVHGANMGPTWVLSAPDGPHVGPMNLAIRGWPCWHGLFQLRHRRDLLP